MQAPGTFERTEISQNQIYIYIPWKSKDYFLNGFSVKTIVLVGIYNQQFKGAILFMVFDFQGIYIYDIHVYVCT